MNTLNLICFGSATIFFGFASIIAFATFFTSLYACFSKKLQGKLWAKILVTVAFGCVCPWLLRLTLLFAYKLI